MQSESPCFLDVLYHAVRVEADYNSRALGPKYHVCECAFTHTYIRCQRFMSDWLLAVRVYYEMDSWRPDLLFKIFRKTIDADTIFLGR
jgi:hypothetical protein